MIAAMISLIAAIGLFDFFMIFDLGQMYGCCYPRKVMEIAIKYDVNQLITISDKKNARHHFIGDGH
jgi:hypothetical protein